MNLHRKLVFATLLGATPAAWAEPPAPSAGEAQALPEATVQALKAAEAAGRKAASKGDQAACVNAALEKTKKCKTRGVCVDEAVAYGKGCLTAARVTAEFCKGISSDWYGDLHRICQVQSYEDKPACSVPVTLRSFACNAPPGLIQPARSEPIEPYTGK